MQMNDVIEFANQNPVTWLATVEDGQPHVRGLLMWFADETGFYYHTASVKSLPKQLEKDPRVEAAFHAPGTNIGESRQLRVTGIAEFVEDEELKERLFQERPWVPELAKVLPGATVKIFRIARGSAHFWHMGVNGHEKDQPRVKF